MRADRAIGRLVAAVVLATLAGCAPRGLRLPSGAGTPMADPAAVFESALGSCRKIASLTAELRLSGRAGGTRLRGTVLVGAAEPAKLRLEGVAPFGAPAFILAASDREATLLLPREDRVLRAAEPAAVLDALAGVNLTAAEVRMILAGCYGADGLPGSGADYPDGWKAIQIAGWGTVWLRERNGTTRLMAAHHADHTVEYLERSTDGFPSRIRVHRSAGPDVPHEAVDLLIEVRDVEVNPQLGPEAFEVQVPDEAQPMSLEELRRSGPLAGTR